MTTHISDSGRRVAEDDDSWAVVVVDEGPEVGAGVGQGPLGDDVLAGMSVALQRKKQLVKPNPQYSRSRRWQLYWLTDRPCDLMLLVQIGGYWSK